MSKLGTFFDILKAAAPIVLAMNPVTAPIAALVVPLVVHAMSEAESNAMGAAQKKARAMAIVSDGVTLAHGAGVAGFEDPAAVLAAVSQGIDVAVDTVHIIDGSRKAF